MVQHALGNAARRIWRARASASSLLAIAAGRSTRPAARPEIGWHDIRLTRAGAADPVTGVLPARFAAFEWHHDECVTPRGAIHLARSANCLQAFRVHARPAWGVQFHLEATHVDLGTWLDGWHCDPGAVATGLGPDAVRRETSAKINRSNQLGRALIESFLSQAGVAWGRSRHHHAPSRLAHRVGGPPQLSADRRLSEAML